MGLGFFRGFRASKAFRGLGLLGCFGFRGLQGFRAFRAFGVLRFRAFRSLWLLGFRVYSFGLRVLGLRACVLIGLLPQLIQVKKNDVEGLAALLDSLEEDVHWQDILCRDGDSCCYTPNP